MSDINKRIDALVKKERRNAVIGVISCVLVSSIFLPLFLPPLGPSSQIEGEVIRLFGKPTDEGASLQLIVKLDDGTEVRSFIANSRLFKKGMRVSLLRREPLVIGRVIYTFQGYVEENRHNNGN